VRGFGRKTFLLCLGLLVFSTCGKKGPPFLPREPMRISVQDLKAERVGGEVALTGRLTYPPGMEKGLPEVFAYRIQHAWYPLESPPCEGCPIDFMGFQVIEVDGVQGPLFRARVPLPEREGFFFFNVRLVGRQEVLGPPSNNAVVRVQTTTP
jgi:hypothetical protein